MHISWTFLSALVLIAAASRPAAAEFPVTERLIRAEIIRLGGTWEGESPAALIGFFGEKFTAAHFGMLAHIEGAGMLSCIDVNVSPAAFDSIAALEALESMQIQRGSFSGAGCEKLKRLRSFSRLRVYECDLTARGVRSIARIRSLRHLELVDVELPPGALRTLAKMKNLEYLLIETSRKFGPDEIQKLKARLPGSKVNVLGDE